MKDVWLAGLPYALGFILLWHAVARAVSRVSQGSWRFDENSYNNGFMCHYGAIIILALCTIVLGLIPALIGTVLSK